MREIRATCGDSKSPSRHNFWVCKKEEFQAFRKICSFITIQNMDEKSREEKMDSLLKVFGHRASIDLFCFHSYDFSTPLISKLRPTFQICPILNFLCASIDFVLFLSCPFCPILSVVQFTILSNLQFCPIYNFVRFGILSDLQFCPTFRFCTICQF